MPEAIKDDETCLHRRMDADAIIYERLPIRLMPVRGGVMEASVAVDNCCHAVFEDRRRGGFWKYVFCVF